MSTTSLLRYPTTVMLIDDNERYLQNLSLRLNQAFPYKIEVNPSEALLKLKQQTQLSSFLKGKLSLHDEHDEVGSVLSFPHLLLPKPDRFDQVSVIVVDYAMPQMSGLELCEQLRDVPLKKIMLTGHADSQVAVDAFNEGLITNFVTKDRPDCFEQLDQKIAKCQKAYWDEHIAPMIEPYYELHSGHDINYRELDRFCEQRGFIERYPAIEKGDFLLFDVNGQPSWLSLLTPERLQSFIDIAEGNGAPSSIITALRSKQAAPFFFTHLDLAAPVDAWHEYLYPLNTCSDEGDFYYLLIPAEKRLINQLPTPTFTYRDFMGNA